MRSSDVSDERKYRHCHSSLSSCRPVERPGRSVSGVSDEYSPTNRERENSKNAHITRAIPLYGKVVTPVTWSLTGRRYAHNARARQSTSDELRSLEFSGARMCFRERGAPWRPTIAPPEEGA